MNKACFLGEWKWSGEVLTALLDDQLCSERFS